MKKDVDVRVVIDPSFQGTEVLIKAGENGFILSLDGNHRMVFPTEEGGSISISRTKVTGRGRFHGFLLSDSDCQYLYQHLLVYVQVHNAAVMHYSDESGLKQFVGYVSSAKVWVSEGIEYVWNEEEEMPGSLKMKVRRV